MPFPLSRFIPNTPFPFFQKINKSIVELIDVTKGASCRFSCDDQLFPLNGTECAQVLLCPFWSTPSRWEWTCVPVIINL